MNASGPRRRETVDVIPAEARAYQGRAAGVASRAAAAAIDVAITLLLLVVIYSAAAAARFLVRRTSFSFPRPGLGLAILLGEALLFAIWTLAWTRTGRSRGARVLGLRVARLGGGRLGPARAAVRSLLCVVFPLGLLWCAISRSKRSIQDLIVGTEVVYDWRPAATTDEGTS